MGSQTSQSFHEVALDKDCFGNCSYCERLHTFRKNLCVSPIDSAIIACNSYGLEAPKHTIRRVNSKIWGLTSVKETESPVQLVLDGLVPETDLEALSAFRNKLHSILILPRPKAEYRPLLSVLESEFFDLPVFLAPEYSGAVWAEWLNYARLMAPHVYSHFVLLPSKPVAITASLRILKPLQQGKNEIKKTLVVASDEPPPSAYPPSVEIIQLADAPTQTNSTVVSGELTDAQNYALSIAQGKRVGFYTAWPPVESLETDISRERFEIFFSKTGWSADTETTRQLGIGFPVSLEEVQTVFRNHELKIIGQQTSLHGPLTLRLFAEHWRTRDSLGLRLLSPVIVAMKRLSDLGHQKIYGTQTPITGTLIFWSTIYPILQQPGRIRRFLFWKSWTLVNIVFWNLIWPLYNLVRAILNLVLWSLLWPLSYPVRKIYYYLSFKLRRS